MASTDTGVTTGSRAVAVPTTPIGGAVGCGTPMATLPGSVPVGTSGPGRVPGITR